MPQLGVSRGVHSQLRSVAAVGKIQREIVDILYFSYSRPNVNWFACSLGLLMSNMQTPPIRAALIFQSIPQSGDNGVVEIVSRRATVRKHMNGVVGVAFSQSRGDNGCESRPVLRISDALQIL